MINELDGIGFLFAIIPVIAYFLIVRSQFSKIEPNTQRLTILSTRTALFLPLYAILIYISLCGPVIYVALTIPITMIEGYSFYCFFTMIVTNLGGPQATVNHMVKTGKDLACACCCPVEKLPFYKKATWALFHLFFTRTILVILSAICFYSDKKIGKVLYALFSLASAGFLFYGLGCLLLLYENVYTHCKNLSGVTKLILLKLSVGAIVLEGLIEQFIVMADASPYNDDSTFSTEEKTQRGYCALVLLEFVILSIVYYFAYGVKITAPPAESVSQQSSTAPVTALTFGQFMCEVLNFRDIFWLLTYKETLTADPANVQGIQDKL